ncbi:hypothetical protein ACLOJK_015232 [Asimina triloba]
MVEFGKEPNRMQPPPPPPPPDDFTYQFNEPFPDFDSIDDWIIEPDSAFVSMEGNCTQEPLLAFSEGTHQPSEPEKEKEEFLKFYGLGHSHVDGPHSKFDERPQCSDGSDLVRTEFQVSQVKHEPAGHSNGYNSTELGLKISEKLGASSISIAEEMGKVSLGGASSAVTTSPERDGPARIDDVTGEAKLNEGVNVDSRVPEEMTAVEDPTEREETEAESDEVSEFSDNEDSSSSRSEEETDSDESEDDDDDGDYSNDDGKKSQRKIDDDGEVEEGEIRDFDQEDTVLASEDEEGGVSKGPIKSKNENEVSLVFSKCIMLAVRILCGHAQIIGAKVIVEGLEKHNPLNEGSILWITATRLPLGLVDEIFGPVKSPYYIVRFNSEEEVPAGMCEGTAISFVAEFANHVLNDTSLYKKGYDASGENDEETFDEAEFSDDEKEAAYRRSLRMAKKGKDRPGNREFEGRKKAQLKFRSGNQEFEGQNKAQIHKNIRHTSSPTPIVGPPVQGMGMPFVPGHLQGPPVLGRSGRGSCGCFFGSGQVGICGPTCVSQASHMAEQATGLGGHVLQPNAGWVNEIPAQQQHRGLLNCFQVNVMPHLPSIGGSNGLTGNQQFDPSYLPLQTMPSQCGQLASVLMNLPGSNGLASNRPFGPSQLPLPAAMQSPCGQLGSMPMNLPGFVGNGSLNQVPFGMGIQSQGTAAFPPHNGPFPSAPSHGGFSEPQKFNPGIASNHGGFSAPQKFNSGVASNRGGFSAPQKFSPGVASNRGRKGFPRGGRGKFSGNQGWRPTAQ